MVVHGGRRDQTVDGGKGIWNIGAPPLFVDIAVDHQDAVLVVVD